MSELIKNDIKVEFWNAGEGNSGDFISDDPTDVNLLRFDVMRHFTDEDEEGWYTLDDASYCTLVPADTSEEVQLQLLEIIMANVYDHASAGISIKKRCEELSWIEPAWLDKP